MFSNNPTHFLVCDGVEAATRGLSPVMGDRGGDICTVQLRKGDTGGVTISGEPIKLNSVSSGGVGAALIPCAPKWMSPKNGRGKSEQKGNMIQSQ